MPVGIYVRTIKIRQGISLGLIGNTRHLGCKHSEKSRARMRANHKGTLDMRFPPRTGNYGHPQTEEGKLKLRSYRGELASNWRGGISKEPYSFDFTEELKESIRERDNHKCQLCGIPKYECLAKLTVHHIDYNKNNSSECNLIALCKGCNAKVNFRREHWQFYFRKANTEETPS